MKTTMEALIAELGEYFRGLWVSNEITSITDKVETDRGWSVTYVYGGEYYEVGYQETAVEALTREIKQLNELKRLKVTERITK